MCRKGLSLLLGFGLLCAPCLVSSEPVLSSLVVTLSPDEYAEIVDAIAEGREALVKSSATIEKLSIRLEESNKLISKQSRNLTMLWIFCGVLSGALVANGIGLILSVR
jgi:hypothetical protein